MSQAQPQPRFNIRRNGRARRPRPRVMDAGPASRAGDGAPGAETLRGTRRPADRHRRPAPLLTFLLGLGLGYGLTGPIHAALNGAMAALHQGTGPLGLLASPLAGIGSRQILVIGVDEVGDNTDVMFTVAVKDGVTSLLQVPRDTFIESERYGVLKANALYAFGGLDATKRELSALLKAPIERHLKVNLRSVERVAEALGGVEVDVPKRMYYVDDSQGLYINLYPGRQLLRGDDLIGYLRFRNDEMGDIGRMERQREVFQQVFSKLIHPSTLTRLPELLQIAGEDIDTDLSPVEFGQLLTAMASTDLSTSQLPGRLFWHEDLSYWMPDSNPHYGSEPLAETATENALGKSGQVEADPNDTRRSYF